MVDMKCQGCVKSLRRRLEPDFSVSSDASCEHCLCESLFVEHTWKQSAWAVRCNLEYYVAVYSFSIPKQLSEKMPWM